MPTGYTAIIEDDPDVTLRQYILRCARAMGPLIHMRDDSLDADLRMPEVHDYHEKALRDAENEYERLSHMTEEEADDAAQAEYDQRYREAADSNSDVDTLRRRYMAMREQVGAWEPPSLEHLPLKSFMLEQIDLCKSDYSREYTLSAERKTRTQWLDEAKARVVDAMARHREAHEKEVKRVEERRKWIEQLLESLPPM